MKNVLLLLVITFSLYSNELSGISSWAYQLQNAKIDEIVHNNTFDLIVMDYSYDGTDASKYSPTEISKIIGSNKVPISYISIGEAEDYRYYWKQEWNSNKPDWLGAENPDWGGNYKVKFWYPEWQDIILDYVDTIVSQGFKGIYLDIVDAYYYWQEEVPTDQKELGADTLMIQFIERLREHVDSLTDSRFYIIPQNGSSIIDDVDSTWKERYFSAIDGIGIEDLFFYGDKEMNNNYNPDTYRLNLLREYVQRNKPVFSIEYLTIDTLIDKYKIEVQKEKFIPYCNDRDLDTLTSGFGGDVAITKGTKTFSTTTIVSLNLVDKMLQVTANNTIVSMKIFSIQGREIRTVYGSSVDITTLPRGLFTLKVYFKDSSNYSLKLSL